MTASEKKIKSDFYWTVLEKHKDTVRGICFRYLHDNSVLCREMIQDVNVAIWNHIDSYPRTSSERIQKHWITVLTRQVVTNSLRRRRVMLTADLRNAIPEPVVTMDGTGEIYEVMRTSLTLEEQLLAQQLIDGYSVNELADAYGVSTSAIHKRIGKLREKFAAALDHNDNPNIFNH